jgi:hypothetical protein
MLNEMLSFFGLSVERHQKPGVNQASSGFGAITAQFDADAARLAADRCFEADSGGRIVPRRRRPAIDSNQRQLGG